MRVRRGLLEITLANIKKTETCWIWTGGHDEKGYGRVHYWVDGRERTKAAHRAVWEALRGPIPHGLQLDHLCEVNGCVNPDHLEPVTGDENLRRHRAKHGFNLPRVPWNKGRRFGGISGERVSSEGLGVERAGRAEVPDSSTDGGANGRNVVIPGR